MRPGACFPGVPSTQIQFLDQCTQSACGQFNTNLPLLNPDGTLPPLP
jgi:hypothetical protein